MDFKWLLFSFDGRLNRMPYWGVVLVMCVLGAGLNFAVGDLGPGQSITAGPAIVEGIFVLLFVWVGLAVQIKRWHDRDKSAWWALLNLVPVIGTLWILIECGFLRGTDGRNRFGPNPLGGPDHTPGGPKDLRAA